MTISLTSALAQDVRDVLQVLDKNLKIHGYNEEGELVPLNLLYYSSTYEEYTLEYCEDDEQSLKEEALTIGELLADLGDHAPNDPILVWEVGGGKMNPLFVIEQCGDVLVFSS